MKTGTLVKLIALLSLFLLVLPSAALFPFADKSLDEPLLTLDALEGTLGGKATYGEGKVDNLGLSGGDIEGNVFFFDLPLETKEYLLVLTYCSGSDDRYFILDCGSESVRVNCPNTGSFGTPGQAAALMILTRGSDLIVGSDWYAPDLVRVEIYDRSAFPLDPPQASNEGRALLDNNDGLTLAYATDGGVYSLYEEGAEVLKNASFSAVIDGKSIQSSDFAVHRIKEQTESRLTVEHTDCGVFGGYAEQTFLPVLGGFETTLTFYAASGEEISLSSVSPFVAGRDATVCADGVFLKIPFDNDAWIEPHFLAQNELGFPSVGYALGAWFDAGSGKGLILGALDHDVYKTGVEAYGLGGKLARLSVTCGSAGSGTHDRCPHAPVAGASVSSAAVYIGYSDWQQGLRSFARVCTEHTPPVVSGSSLIGGFNSWGSMQSGVSYSAVLTVSDFIKNELQTAFENNGGCVYVVLDAYFDRLASNDPFCDMTLDEALSSFASHCRENGQKAGIYFTPFAAWAEEEELREKKIAGTDYSFYDAALRLPDGSLWGRLDGGWPLDPTHPGTKAYIRERISYFKNLGFEYIKLDFLTHGALEGAHYAGTVTGMQAYNEGMKLVRETCGSGIFLDLSISPIFPYGYAEGRRMSCDAFASLDDTKHLLSHLTACFFEDILYAHPDPDHLVLTGVSEGVARARATSGVISGSSILSGDDLSAASKDAAKKKRIVSLLGNEKALSTVAARPASFLPIGVKAGTRYADAYICADNDKLFLALFNFDLKEKKISLDLTPWTGEKDALAVEELWRALPFTIEDGVLSGKLPMQDAALFLITPGDHVDRPTPTPTETQTVEPTEEPTAQPTAEPTAQPTGEPTAQPTEEPTAPETPKKDAPWIRIPIAAAGVLLAAGGAAALIVRKKRKK